MLHICIIYIYLSIYPSIHPSIHLSYLSIYIYILPTITTYTYSFTRLHWLSTDPTNTNKRRLGRWHHMIPVSGSSKALRPLRPVQVLELPTFLLLKLLLPRHRSAPGSKCFYLLVRPGGFADIPVTCSYVAFLYMLPSAISDILWIRVAYY